MKFQFESLQGFLWMSGHGPYVWACYVITALALTYLLLSPVIKRRALMADLKRQARVREHEMRHQTS
ncbi:heme exporter protein CcmD [Aestuariicella hydrocarbonica]|uniref:Heme exporter protein D n=1 Tax=Pseudomaricurvus hydrocarbonicus TaxID=1470433 RepID=A0A9E5MLU3_9GAMM|nr:heme exporter protein CcmD [Aestuariicella hydrocarbonica]NHO65498.1 heme exporter protein CcmD [Aestuariicella hydrocarbonica]